MPRISRLLFAASLVSLAALLPVAAEASTNLTEYVVGSEYALGSCVSGSTGSFAGVGSATPGGQANAIFDTTICHTPLGDTTGATATILSGGSFTLHMSSVTLVGQYKSGSVGPGSVSPLYPGSRYFCHEVFPVTAVLGPATNVPAGATNITSGSVPVANLTHIGVFSAGGGCVAFAAKITGVATL
jgi:hypothetical protein